MQIVFFNAKTQNSYPVEVDDALGDQLEDIKLMCNGDVYNLVNTVPDEIKRLNKLREDFENMEFDNLTKEFGYKTRDDVPDNFPELFATAIAEIKQQGKHKEFFESIKDNAEAVITTLRTHFLTFLFMMQRFKQINDENKKNMMDVAFAKDYAGRYKRLFSREYWENKKTLKELGEEVDQIRRYMDIDERRHCGRDEVLAGIGKISPNLSAALVGQDPKSVTECKINKEDPKFGKAFAEIYTVFKHVYDYYDQMIKKIDASINMLRDKRDSKHIAYLKLAKPIVVKFLTDTDTYLKDASKIEGNDKAKLELVKNTYIENLRQYYDNLDHVYTLYDCDSREVDPEEEKQFIALWESSIYYRSSVSMGDWFVQLARLIYKSYNDLFAEILSEDEKVKAGEPVK